MVADAVLTDACAIEIPRVEGARMSLDTDISRRRSISKLTEIFLTETQAKMEENITKGEVPEVEFDELLEVHQLISLTPSAHILPHPRRTPLSSLLPHCMCRVAVVCGCVGGGGRTRGPQGSCGVLLPAARPRLPRHHPIEAVGSLRPHCHGARVEMGEPTKRLTVILSAHQRGEARAGRMGSQPAASNEGKWAVRQWRRQQPRWSVRR